MNAAVVKAHRAGLFSNINKVITALRIYEHVHIDWSDCIYGDCWDSLFNYNDYVSPNENHDIIIDYPFYDLTAACAGIMYQNEGWGWRTRFHPLWKKLKPFRQPIKVSNRVGVLVRGHHHGGEQLSGLSQTYDEYAKAIENSGLSNVYLMCGDEESASWFSSRFNVVYQHDTKRVPTRYDGDQHLSTPQTSADAAQAMFEATNLASCEALIHPVSNISTYTLIANPNVKSIYLK